MRMNLRDYRINPDDQEWDLPAWGHPIGQGVMPMFVSVRGRLFPIGTAFTTGTIHFVITATHNVAELLTRDPRFENKVNRGPLLGNYDASEGHALYVLHHRAEADLIHLTLWPLRKIDGASPGDVVFAHPQYAGEIQTLMSPLSFDLPKLGETVMSVGYSEFTYPEDGINFEEAKAGRFDWRNDYSHRLFVAEGAVQRIFTQKFANGFVAGPCFAFDALIRHGMSGGPIYNSAGDVCGVNSAGAEMYFGSPMSLGSLLYPMLARPLRFGAELGPLTLNATRPMMDLIAEGILKTDGSHEHVGFTTDPIRGGLIAHPRSLIKNRPYVHDDFAGYQAGRTSTKLEGEHFVFRARDDEPKSEP